MINSFKAFDRAIIATAALFLAAKVEEHPRKLDLVAKCSYTQLHKESPPLETQSEAYNKMIDDITYHELVILETLGFDVQVRHPHPHVVECMNLVGVSKDLSQAAFFLAHNSQLLTTFCLQYPPTVVACMCIHLTCAWKGLEIPRSSDNKNWWEYVDKTVTWNKLEELAKEFLTIVDKSPSRLKKRIQENFRMAVEGARPHGSSSSSQSSSSTSTHGNRQPSVLNILGSSSNRHKDKLSHAPSSISINKHRHQQHGVPAPKVSVPSSSNKLHRSSSPPPPPPPPPVSQSTQSELQPTANVHKHHKHKERSRNQNSSIDIHTTSKLQKHSLNDPLNTNKQKRFKSEDTTQPISNPHKQHLTLSDYRQSKRQQHQHFEGPKNKRVISDIKTEPITPHSSELKMPSLPSLPPLPNARLQHSMPYSSLSSLSSVNAKPNVSSLPPLPPPLPSKRPSESPPPPPPPPRDT